jgi:putative ABC transport system substrate-binding protein
MRRRDFIVGASAAAAWPIAARGQQPERMRHIGILLAGTPTSFAPRANAFVQGLRELGYVEGKTVAFEWKWGEDRTERLPQLAEELVRLDVDAIVTGGTPAAKALKSATQTIPIVMAIIGDPVAVGLVQSLARPGGNATGFSIVAPDLSGKRLQLLKELLPDLSSVAAISTVTNPQAPIELKETQAAAKTLDIVLHSVQVSDEVSVESAFDAIKQASAQAVIVLTDAILYSQRNKIASLAAANRLPGMYHARGFVEAGGLISYAPSDTDLFRRAATYVDKIFKGANPGDLPIEQPTKFELVINLTTAKALGLSIPQSLLATADGVIE